MAAFLAEMDKRRRLEEVNRKKLELKEQEELMYFFENEDEIDKVVEKKERKLRRPQSRLSTQELEDTYVPPEVRRRTTGNTGE